MRERDQAPASVATGPAARALDRRGAPLTDLARAGGNRFTQALSRKLMLLRNGGGATTLSATGDLGLDSGGLTELKNALSVIGGSRAKPYKKDGTKFGNREGRLPAQSDKNYYKEWTVTTPGASDRGERRIVTGKGGEYYFTDDHYGSFTQFDPTK